tara:strand:+ start:33 stop:662 length:630 start_codon:yes stop_codon:yes gene_type:complete
MPNITKYMGRAIPGMSMVQGAWDAGQGVSSLVEGLQRMAAKQSGGPMPMEDIAKWIHKNNTPQEKFTLHNKQYRLPRDDTAHQRMSYSTKWSNQDPQFDYIENPRALGAEEKSMYDDVIDFHSQSTRWEFDVEKMVEALKDLKSAKNKNKKNRLKSELRNRLGKYIDPPDRRGEAREGQRDYKKYRGKTKAKDSIWMSVLDAMKRQEKK